MAVFTVVFAIGQSMGPVLSGWIADAAHSLNASLAASVVILLGASVAGMHQRENTIAPASPISSTVAVRSSVAVR
jgi:cyanate permease